MYNFMLIFIGMKSDTIRKTLEKFISFSNLSSNTVIDDTRYLNRIYMHPCFDDPNYTYEFNDPNKRYKMLDYFNKYLVDINCDIRNLEDREINIIHNEGFNSHVYDLRNSRFKHVFRFNDNHWSQYIVVTREYILKKIIEINDKVYENFGYNSDFNMIKEIIYKVLL